MTTKVRDRLAEAAALAGRAALEARRAAPGRRHPTRLAPFAAALARLDALVIDLAGAGPDADAGLIRAARVDLYRLARRLWWPFIPAAYRDPAAGPTAVQLTYARSAAIDGRELYYWIRATVNAVRAGLAAAAERDTRGMDPDARALDAWEASARAGVTKALLLILSDALYDADRRAGRDLFRAEHLDSEI